MEIQIKLTKEQHDLLLDRLGSEESIHEWLQHCLDQKMQEMVNSFNSQLPTDSKLSTLNSQL